MRFNERTMPSAKAIVQYLLPNIEVGVNAHHNCANATPALKHHYPGSVAKENDGEEKLDPTAASPDPVDVIVQRLPHLVAVRIDL